MRNMKPEIPYFSLSGKIYKCTIVDIYDGDTITVIFKFSGKYYKWKVRMLGYDSPEIRISKKDQLREEKKKLGIDAREYLREIIQKNSTCCLHKKYYYIKCGKFDKYGRLLGEIYKYKKDIKRDNSINSMMLQSKHAVEYMV